MDHDGLARPGESLSENLRDHELRTSMEHTFRLAGSLNLVSEVPPNLRILPTADNQRGFATGTDDALRATIAVLGRHNAATESEAEWDTEVAREGPHGLAGPLNTSRVCHRTCSTRTGG